MIGYDRIASNLAARGADRARGRLSQESLPTQSVEATSPTSPAGDHLPRGARIGPYRIEELLGAGGMGEVYRAEQLEPVRRTVALKRMRSRALDLHQRAFFEVERQLLAQMRHPGIAQVFDAGTTAEGDPYFAMELIEGSPITDWCDLHALNLDARLRLFAKVCAAAQHAHQKGVIHRDIKPGNILVAEVDSAPMPKIIDFGIATASGSDQRERAGTPDYMSPEQTVAGADIDTRSDVYALGVVLCELLTSQRPADSSTSGTGSSRAHTETKPPSQRLADLGPERATRRAAMLGISPGRLRHLLRHELDWVVLKAVAQDRNERYASAAALADDLQRYLDAKPLEAVPRSWVYTAGKYLRRHRVAAVSGGLVLAALVAGLAAALQGLTEAEAQRAVAEQRLQDLERVSTFQRSLLERLDIGAMGQTLQQSLREQALQSLQQRPIERLDGEHFEQLALRWNATDIARELVNRHVLADAEASIERSFGGNPRVASDLQSALAELYMTIGLWDEAVRLHRSVLATRSSLFTTEDDKVLETQSLLGHALSRAGDADAAMAVMAPAIKQVESRPTDDPIRVRLLIHHAQALSDLGRSAEAIAGLESINTALQALDTAEPGHRELVINNLGIALFRAGERDRAVGLMEALLELRRDRLGPEHADTLATQANLGNMMAVHGDLERALEVQRGVAELHRRTLGDEHPLTLGDRNNVAATLISLGRLEEAEPELRDVYELRSRVLGPFHPMTLRSAVNLAALHAERGDDATAIEIQRDVWQRRQALLGAEHPDTLGAAMNLASSLSNVGRLEEAKAIAVPHQHLRERVLGPQHPDTLTSLEVLADIARQEGDIDTARTHLEAALSGWEAQFGRERPQTLLSAARLVELERTARPERAAVLQARYLDPFLDQPEDQLPPPLRNARKAVEQRLGIRSD